MPIGRLSTIFPMVGIFVYYKNMKFTDQFSIVLTSEQYDMLNEVMPFAASFDFTEHHEGKIFDILWDKILNADHKIITEDSWASFLNSILDS